MKQCASSVRIRILVKSQRIRTYMDFDTQRFKEVSRYWIFPDTEKVRIREIQAMTLDGNVARKEHGTPRNYRIYKVYGCESLNFRATILFILRSETFNSAIQTFSSAIQTFNLSIRTFNSAIQTFNSAIQTVTKIWFINRVDNVN